MASGQQRRHEVIFEYVPGGVRLGGVLSLASLGMLAAVWLARRGRA